MVGPGCQTARRRTRKRDGLSCCDVSCSISGELIGLTGRGQASRSSHSSSAALPASAPPNHAALSRAQPRLASAASSSALPSEAHLAQRGVTCQVSANTRVCGDEGDSQAGEARSAALERCPPCGHAATRDARFRSTRASWRPAAPLPRPTSTRSPARKPPRCLARPARPAASAPCPPCAPRTPVAAGPRWRRRRPPPAARARAAGAGTPGARRRRRRGPGRARRRAARRGPRGPAGTPAPASQGHHDKRPVPITLAAWSGRQNVGLPIDCLVLTPALVPR
jgi:hypothetical protein